MADAVMIVYAPLFALEGESPMKYTVAHENNFTTFV
jgi:hypothetical protein